MNPRWLLRASKLARHPQKARRVWLVMGVVVACLALAGLERLTVGDGDGTRKNRHPFTSN